MASLVWVCLAYVFSASHGPLTGPAFVGWFVLPLLLIWGGVWILSSVLGKTAKVESAESAVTAKPTRAENKVVHSDGLTRFYARSFDLLLWSFLVGYPIGLIVAEGLPLFAGAVGSHGLNFAIALYASISCLLLASSLGLDALIYRLFGNTPGKALLGITVHTRTGDRLSPGQYLNRNFSIWARGFAFGLPLLSFVAVCVSGVTLWKKGATRWDSYWGYEVNKTPQKTWRVAVFMVVGVLLLTFTRMSARELGNSLAAIVVADRMVGSVPTSSAASRTTPPNATLSQSVAEQQPVAQQNSEKIVSRAIATATWRNPISGLPALLDSRWQEDSAHEDQDNPLLFITQNGDRVMSVQPVISEPYSGDFYKPVTALKKRVESGRVVFEGEGFGVPGPQTAALYPYVGQRGEPRVRPFMRAWVFEGSGTYWMILYAADASVTQPDEAARAFFSAVLKSTRVDQPATDLTATESPIRWLNPVTGNTVKLAAHWGFNPYVPSKANPWAYTSLLRCSQIVGAPCGGGEEAVGVRYFPDSGDSPQNLQEFAQTMHAAKDPVYPLLVQAREEMRNGRHVWEGESMGYAALTGGYHTEFVRFWLFRSNNGFWRVTYAAEPSFPRDTKDAEEFFNDVFSTTTP
ncbi:RDD family protein [Caballeronia sordidicola]|uniref:RDD family protein n=1 Tax=Caballeronia sordidicola TaxID=196367 RepID=UPI0015C5020E|nr:RDD family protein [Caballeronia sordidicola]